MRTLAHFERGLVAKLDTQTPKDNFSVTLHFNLAYKNQNGAVPHNHICDTKYP